ncbi:MAG: VCBS repeat-containing protein [Deltaproteobacteria bacterium]|nr:VCBS repeat-containing protein [Deltaproteobacteria bacterium]
MPDFNGDGLGDLVVGAPLSGTGQTGRVYAYYGVRGGLPSVVTFRIGSPFTTDPSFGSTVASAGDVNGDGYADLAVGSRAHTYVYYGSARGILTTPGIVLDAPVSGDREFGGSGFASMGDLNNDGFADFAIGSSSQRRVYIYRGGPAGLGTLPNQTLANPDGTSFYGFGTTIAALGDIDGNGYSDLAVGADSRMYVYQNGVGGVPMNPTFQAPRGGTVSGPGDYNGDGYGDLVAGSDVYWGGMFGFFGSPGQSLSRIDGTYPNYEFKSAGDVNGDGYSDIAAGNIVYYGGSSGFRVPIVSSSTVLYEPSGGALGQPVSCVGDVNGDGLADLLYPVGDRNVLLFQGATGGVATRPALTLTCPDVSMRYGHSIAARGRTGGFIDLVGRTVRICPRAWVDPCPGVENLDGVCLLKACVSDVDDVGHRHRLPLRSRPPPR